MGGRVCILATLTIHSEDTVVLAADPEEVGAVDGQRGQPWKREKDRENQSMVHGYFFKRDMFVLGVSRQGIFFCQHRHVMPFRIAQFHNGQALSLPTTTNGNTPTSGHSRAGVADSESIATAQINSWIGSGSARIDRGRPKWSNKVPSGSMPSTW